MAPQSVILTSLRRSIVAVLVPLGIGGGCQRGAMPDAPTSISPLEEHASTVIVTGTLRTSLGAAVAGAPIRVESLPFGCSLPVTAWQVTFTGSDGTFSSHAYGPNNVNMVGCIVARDTLLPSSPSAKVDSLRFKLSPPFDTVRLTLTR